MKNSAQQNMKAGDVSLGLSHHFIGAFGRAGGTAEMLQLAADDRSLMQKLVGIFQPTVLAAAIAATFVTADYFVTRSGLWVSDDFKSRITSAYPEALVPRGLNGVEHSDLDRDSSDTTIIARPEMGGLENVRKHAVMPDQIGALINLQPNGEAGRLLTNGCTNLFYVVGAGGKLFVVRVYWSAGSREWRVFAWEFGEGDHWGAGLRVFRNTRPSALA